jgi:hypothetical protein
MSEGTTGRSIRLFLVNGTPTGLITSEIINWTGHALSGPYSRLQDILRRPETSRSGIYFLIGDDAEDPTRLRLYIGESENTRDRLYQHERSDTKDFAERVCIVTSKDANLTKGHIRYLESRLIEMAERAGRIILDNGTRPPRPMLPESDVADMEFFLSQIAVVLPILGFDFLRPTRPVVGPPGTSAVDTGLRLFLKPERSASPLAAAIYKDTDFIVLKDSRTRPDAPESVNPYRRHRQALIDSSRLQPAPDGQGYIFVSDTPFSSPSAAAAVVLDRNANGRLEWRIEGTGQKLKDYQDSMLLEPESE